MFHGEVVRNQWRSMSGSTMELQVAVTDTSNSLFFCAWSHAADSRTVCLTVTPIWRHWSMSQTPTGSYGMGTARFSNVNDKPSAPASRSEEHTSELQSRTLISY